MKIIFILLILFLSESGFSQIVIDVDTSKGIKVFAINPIRPQIQDSIPKATVTNGYWSWQVTANTEVNHLNMRMAKLKFKEEHPDIFAKIACVKPEISVLKNDEFLSLGPEIKEYILSHPELFKVLPQN